MHLQLESVGVASAQGGGEPGPGLVEMHVAGGRRAADQVGHLVHRAVLEVVERDAGSLTRRQRGLQGLPLFVEQGDRVTVDTRSGEYLTRV